MTGPLNPRRYDLGELRDAARDPAGRPAAGESPPERSDGGQRDGSTPASGERNDGEQSVPVEPTTPRAGEQSPPRGEPERATDAPPESRREPADARDANAAVEGASRRSEPASDRGRAATDADGRREPADEVESYLRSRHRRRDAGGHRSERRSRGTDEHAPPRPDRKQASPDPEAPGGGRTRDAAAVLAELSGPDVSKPYLDRLPDAYTAQLEVFEWLERLLTAAGHEATLSALEYYESIGWLSERSREELEEVASGLSAPGPEAAAPSLGVDDHRESLLYVARLAGRRTG